MESCWKLKRSYTNRVANAHQAQQYQQHRMEPWDMVECGYYVVRGDIRVYNTPAEQGSTVRHSSMTLSGWQGHSGYGDWISQ
eukprot:1202640-Pyramimonas_sp.AAC.1